MYAPASPARPASLQLEQISSPNFSSPHTRPLSDPVSLWRKRRSSLVGDSKTSPMNKRATWNGSYLSLAHAGSSQAANAPSGIPVLSRKADRRRSELGSLFSPPRTRVLSAPSAPLSPRILADVQEETDGDASDNRLSVSLVEDDEDEEQRNDIPVLKEKGYFGIAALDLQRKRRSMGMEAFRLSSLPSSPTPPPRYLPSSPTPRSSYSFSFHKHQSSGSPSPPPTLSSSTRFTLPHTSRHPLSLSALRLALHGALASKRYASSHLLALRFDEEEGEDESYWEDVRSVMSLLVGALGDASGRLKEALDDTEKRKDRDATISPPRTHLDDSDNADLKKKWEGKARSMAEMISFAPMPSHLTRFAAHVDAISSALNDARSHLEETVAAIRDPSPLSSRSTSSTSSTPTSPTTATPTPQPHAPRSGLEASAALQAYDRLRKELGYALRECERGRDRLIDILNPPRPSNPEPEDTSDDDGMADRDSMMATPPLVLDTSSDSSSRIGSASLQGSLGLDFTVVETTGSASDELDDVTRHLLLSTSSECLPPAGVEQVYEADSADLGLYRRERSTLSREERIKLAKARRESAKGLISGVGRNSLTVQDDGEGGGGLRRGWSGPGGEVVQELKDVIWKVGEKRRRMSELASMPVATPANLADGDATLPLSALPTIITGEEEYLEFSRMGRMSLPPLPSILDAFEPPEGGDEGVFETGEEVLL